MGDPTSPPLAELDHIRHVYGRGPQAFVALEDVSLRVHEGEFVALLGPSGCGKSTLLRILMGLQVPTHGEVRSHGRPLRGVNPRASIVFQSFALFPWLTIQQNVEIGLAATVADRHARTVRARDVLDRVGLDGFESAYPRELSGGMRQKAGFARALAVEPELLCLDEPFSALDVLSAQALRNELLELWVSGRAGTRAILMVTHNVEEAVTMADRIVVMDKRPGRVVTEMTVDLARPRNRRAKSVIHLVDAAYSVLAGETAPEALELGTMPGERGPTRALPDVSFDAIAGILEHLAELDAPREDVFRLARELRLGADQVLALTDACELLGFAQVVQGDVMLLEAGRAYASADILDRKVRFAERVSRLPIVRWLLNMLQASDTHDLEADVLLAALQLDFPGVESETQLNILLRWARFAELIEFDEPRGRITVPIEVRTFVEPS